MTEILIFLIGLVKWRLSLLIDYLFLDENKCNFCQEEFIYKYGLCKNCYDKLDYVDNKFLIDDYEAYSIYFYNDFFKRLIGLYKFERKTEFSRIFSKMLYEYGSYKSLFDVDYILPSPSSDKTIINRGFDHIKMITDDFIEKIPPVYLDGFKKVKNTKAQHNLDKEERMTNLSDAFSFDNDLSGKKVLIVDDIITTGNTTKEMIKVLKRANVANIKILVLASERKVL